MIRLPAAFTASLLGLLSSIAAQQIVYRSSREAIADPAIATMPGGAMLSLPGVFTDFVLAGGGQYVELQNGTARLTARVFSAGSLYSAFLLELSLSGRVAPGNPAYPPSGCPVQQLLPAAYVPSGPVDPGAFVYYTAATGTLTGVRDYDGAVLSLALNGAVQVGNGANNRNAGPGLQADFSVAIVQQPSNPLTPTGTASLAIDFCAPEAEDTTHPQPDPTRTTLPFGRAMVLPGVANDYVFVPAAAFTEFPDGHAELTGRLARLAQLDDAWHVALTFTNRVSPGQPAFPPAGSPVLQMLPGAYTGNGGTMNPASWHYYTTGTGTLTGAGANTGGTIALASTTALQVGGGANQTNTYFGFHGAFTATIVAQPASHQVVVTGAAELFGLTAVFPVLPFPSLTVPASMPVLPTLTDQGLVLQGDNLAWVELMGLNGAVVGSGGPASWYGGWFRVVDNQHVEFHPAPGSTPGVYNCAGFNPAVMTNTIQVQLQAPPSPVLFAEATVGATGTAHVLLHRGAIAGPAVALITASPTFAPSIAPGIASLLIGNGFADLVVDPSAYLHDPVTGIAAASYGPIPPSLLGAHLWFQGLIVDVTAITWPLPATNAWRIDFV